MNYLKDSIFDFFLRSIIYSFLKKFFSQHILTEILSFEEENIIKYIKLFLN